MTQRPRIPRPIGVGLVAVIACSLGCAAPEAYDEESGFTSTKLLKAHVAADLGASDTNAFVAALGGEPVEIDAWRGYVAGTTDDALLAFHFSGVKETTPAAGLTIALNNATDDDLGNLQARVANATRLEVRLNDGSGIVSTHDFTSEGPGGMTNAAHRGNARSDALLKRAFNDAEALLRAPVENAGGGDGARDCLASYLATISAATRCVDDVANVNDCAAVRPEAILTTAKCAGTPTANVLEGAGKVRPAFLGGLFSSFFDLRGPSTSFGSQPDLLFPSGGVQRRPGVSLGSSSPFGGGLGGLLPALFGGGLSPFGGGVPFTNPFGGLFGGEDSFFPADGFMHGDDVDFLGADPKDGRPVPKAKSPAKKAAPKASPTKKKAAPGVPLPSRKPLDCPGGPGCPGGPPFLPPGGPEIPA